MIETIDDRRNSVRQLLATAALIALGYVCIRTLRFTNGGLNLVFACVFFLTPFLAIRPLRRLRSWPKVLGTIVLTPFLALSLLLLLMEATCEAPAVIQGRELSWELSVAQQEHSSIHLLRETTAGGAVGRHGLGLEQRMFILPGIYTVKYVDYFEGAYQGSMSVEATNRVRLHIDARENWNPEIDKVYVLKPWVYF